MFASSSFMEKLIEFIQVYFTARAKSKMYDAESVVVEVPGHSLCLELVEHISSTFDLLHDQDDIS